MYAHTCELSTGKQRHVDSWCSVARQPSLDGGLRACERPCLKRHHCPPALRAHKMWAPVHTYRETDRDRGKDKYVSALEERKPFLKSDDLLRRLAGHRHLAVLMVSVSRWKDVEENEHGEVIHSGRLGRPVLKRAAQEVYIWLPLRCVCTNTCECLRLLAGNPMLVL